MAEVFMSHEQRNGETGGADRLGFTPTRWSVVLAVADPARRAEALDRLCRTYWEPLYVYIRCRDYQRHDAEDLTQSFFAYLLERHVIEAADPERGRFRYFLLACLKNFLANERAKANAKRRDGGKIIVPLDAETAEKHYQQDAPESLTAQQHFDRRWALILFDRAFAQLSGEALAAGKAEQFEALKPFLSVKSGEANYATASARLKMTATAVRQEVHRLRRRLRELVRAEIARTVRDPGDIDDEMRYLIKLLSG